MLLKNQRGQFLVEAVLLMTIALGLTMAGIRIFRDNKVLSHMVQGPWDRTSGMIEAGVWESPKSAQKKIPYSYNRFYTPHSE